MHTPKTSPVLRDRLYQLLTEADQLHKLLHALFLASSGTRSQDRYFRLLNMAYVRLCRRYKQLEALDEPDQQTGELRPAEQVSPVSSMPAQPLHDMVHRHLLKRSRSFVVWNRFFRDCNPKPGKLNQAVWSGGVVFHGDMQDAYLALVK